MESDSLEALVTDPPYGLSKMTTENIQECLNNWLSGETYTHKEKGFMNKAWDSFVPSPELWREVFRVLKPGAHGLVFAGSRTQDLMSISLRLAGFEIRDTLMWVYGSGFPKSHNISKAIDKKLGTLKVVGQGRAGKNALGQDSGYNKTYNPHTYDIVEANSEEAKEWNGWGTALKPAYEPIILVRKPPVGSIAQNTLDFGCGGINIDATRIQYGEDENINFNAQQRQQANCEDKGWSGHVAQVGTEIQMFKEKGRFPANVMIDEHIDHEAMKRYFYCTKAGKKEKEAGLEELDSKAVAQSNGAKAALKRNEDYQVNDSSNGFNSIKVRKNTHPTVKPLDLMRYLVKMVVPPSGTALDPFCGSGSTLCALALENMNGIGIELQEEYCEIAQARVKHWGGEAERVGPPSKELEELPLFKGLL